MLSSPPVPSKRAGVLWGTHGPGGHAGQVYASEAELVDTLTGYAGGALWNGEAVLLVATHAHVSALEIRLRESGLDLSFLRRDDRYVAVPAETTLEQISVDGRPDEARFTAVVEGLLERADWPRRRVRLFGEMVALLWQRGQYEAALHLERLWNRFLETHALPLLCAYPRRDFERAGSERMAAAQREHAVLLS